jgi:hypothetical protein
MILFERRAAHVLYNLLRTREDARPFLLPANACSILPETFAAAGQPVDLVDIAEPWLEIDADACAMRLRARAEGYAGLLFIHPYGSERDATPLFAALKDIQSNLFIIDDKCLCRPDCGGESLSPFADVTLFSTGHTKYADLGEGGFAHAAEPVTYTRHLPAPEISWIDYRDRAAGAARAADAQKAALNAIYERLLPAEICFPSELQRWRFNIHVPEAERLIEDVFASGLFASRHYPPLGDFAMAARLHAGVVNLFNDRYFDAERAERISEIVLRHLETIAPPAHPLPPPPTR